MADHLDTDPPHHAAGTRPGGGRRAPSRAAAPTEPVALRLHRAEDLIDAVPYLLGFRPRDSVVLVGIESPDRGAVGAGGRVRITARMDIADLGDGGLEGPAGDNNDNGAGRAAWAIRRSGANSVVGLVFVDGPAARTTAGEAGARAARACADAGLELGPLIVVDDAVDAGTGSGSGSATDDDSRVGPTRDRDSGDGDAGRPRTSRVAAEATYAGLVALDDRRDLVELLTAEPATHRRRLTERLDSENTIMRRVDADGHRRRRGAIRALFAASRTLAVLDDASLVRFGAALAVTEVRDACWLAVEAGRIDGEPLWRELGRRLPAPYDAAPLFLFGWQRWRHGDGVLGGIAARRALDSDPGYSAAHLLETAIVDGLDPYRTPRLRKGA